MLNNRTAIRNRIFKWFDNRQRDLPWLKKRTPYKIWVSEIMLQQTQIVTVIDYFERFIKRFPTVNHLAEATEEEVLSLWEGLGYYRRARQLHKAARKIVQRHEGKFPTDYDSVLALPGIGRYTAGAILSISLDQRLPILEGNTIRLFSRLIGLQNDVTSRESQNQLWEISEALLPANRTGDFNQALMDFGREVCRAKNPECQSCCLRDYCVAGIKGLQNQIPFKALRMKFEDLNEAIILIRRRNRVLMRLCLDGERWAGLWDFPRFKNSGLAKLESTVFEEAGLNVELRQLNYSIKHAVTRFRIQLDCFESDKISGRLKRNSRFVWKSIEEIEQLPLSVTGRKFAATFL